ncbi:MAG: LPS translocon maturation chaperone LptM [Acidiferrobacterales bacterium]
MNLRLFALRILFMAALASAFGLSGCGLKGPLYLPSQPAPHKALAPAPSR